MGDSTLHCKFMFSIIVEHECIPGRSIAFANNKRDVMKFKELC